MYWLYFARDFYRAGNKATALACAPMVEPLMEEAPIAFSQAQVAVSLPTESLTAAAKPRSVAKQQREYVVRSAPVAVVMTEPAAQAPAREETPNLSPYLKRLSVDGEHAFGVWDEDAGFSLFSANFDRVTGLASGECAGHDWIHMIHHTQQYAVNEALLQALAGHDGQCLVQAQRLKEDADMRWLMMDIKAARGQQQDVMVLFRDLTEKMALEEALKQTEAALAMSQRSRAAFLSSMSHELRTPLNAIMGFSEMMRSAVFGELGNPTYKEYAKHIFESGNLLLGKINDLLDIASMDAGGLELEESDFYLAELLNEAIQMHSHHAFERQQYIQIDCPYPIELFADRSMMLCATSHLISNALRHSKPGAEISVCVRIQGDDLIVSVHDTGEGIPQNQLDIIREALNADVTYFKISSGGIGLGLSLSKELACRHGGRVMIDSVRHRGTVVAMILPTTRILSGMPQSKRRTS